jgi:hypothetical protein
MLATRTRRAALVLAALAVVAVLGAGYVQSQRLRRFDVFVRNGDAELPGSSDGVRGWHVEGGLTIIRYGMPHDPTRGRQLFAGGLAHAGRPSRAWQDIVVRRGLRAIDAGRVEAILEASIGGLARQADSGVVVAMFAPDERAFAEPGADRRLGRVSLGPVLPADRDFATQLLDQIGVGKVPPGTRVIRVEVLARWVEGRRNDAYFDNVSLRLSEP